jgi:ATPase family associated with various cellular activities (AAA)
MFGDYSDITDRIAESPKWWDERGVPRYAEFEPHRVANIYAREVVLIEIACHACGRHFEVALSGQGGAGSGENGRSMAENIRAGEIAYGDPPNYGNCRDGASTTCYNLRVLQYWRRPHGAWTRDPTLEMTLPQMSDYLKHHHRPETAPKIYDPSAGWVALALPQDTVNQLRIMAKMLREGDPLAPRNLLLFGPQESNKTEVVRQFARETIRALIVADASDVVSAFIGQVTQSVAHLFAHARARTPCILFFNDVEMFADATNEVVLQLLTEIEINREINRDVFLVAATARPEVVDAAIRSHIARHIEIPVPGQNNASLGFDAPQ